MDEEGRKIVVINDIRFKGKTVKEWDEIEKFLYEYVGKFYEIEETAEKIYIGKDFPDEFVHGKDKTVLKGPNLKAKANISQAVGELIQIATNKSSAEDYGEKHGKKANQIDQSKINDKIFHKYDGISSLILLLPKLL